MQGLGTITSHLYPEKRTALWAGKAHWVNWIFGKYQRQHASILLWNLPAPGSGLGLSPPLEQQLWLWRWALGRITAVFCWPGHNPLLLRDLLEEQRAGPGCFPSPENALLCSGRSLINKITATVTLLIALALPGLVRFSPAHYLVQCKTVISGNCRAPWKPPQVPHGCTARGHLTAACTARGREQMGPREEQGNTKYQQQHGCAFSFISGAGKAQIWGIIFWVEEAQEMAELGVSDEGNVT